MGTSPGIGAGVRKVQGRIAPQPGNEVQVVLPRHIARVVVAQVPIQDEVGQGTTRAISASKAAIMALIRTSSGVSVPGAWGLFGLPLGRPSRRRAHGALGFLAAALALLATFSASLRTTCSRPVRHASAMSAGPAHSRATGRRRPALAPACRTSSQRNEQGHGSSSQLW
jgi:hypothetical protein